MGLSTWQQGRALPGATRGQWGQTTAFPTNTVMHCHHHRAWENNSVIPALRWTDALKHQ